MRNLIYKSFFLLSIFALIFSCKKEDDSSATSTISFPNDSISNEAVLVLNEGQFLAANASISLHENEDKTTAELYSSINDMVLGDVLQSVLETNSHYFLIVNNSSKIEVVNKSNFKHVKTIEGFQSPRYMLDMGNGKALVSNATFAPGDVEMKLDVVNLSTFTREGFIKVNNWCEQMYLKDGIVYVANTGKNRLILVDPTTLSVIDSIPCKSQPTAITEDSEGNLWVLSLGNYADEAASIAKLIVSIKSIDFVTSADISPQKMAMNKIGDKLYVLADKVYTLDVLNKGTILPVDFMSLDNITSPYAFGIDPRTERIYIGDAKDYSSKGTVSVFSKEGAALYSFEVGVNPNSFIFR